jgi:hypothetical protein
MRSCGATPQGSSPGSVQHRPRTRPRWAAAARPPREEARHAASASYKPVRRSMVRRPRVDTTRFSALCPVSLRAAGRALLLGRYVHCTEDEIRTGFGPASARTKRRSAAVVFPAPAGAHSVRDRPHAHAARGVLPEIAIGRPYAHAPEKIVGFHQHWTPVVQKHSPRGSVTSSRIA